MNEPQVITKAPPTDGSVAPADRLTSQATIYEASGMSIFWRNFLAGFSRSLGSLVVYLIFLVVVYLAVSRYVLPHVQPLIDEYLQVLKTFNQFSQPDTNSTNSLDIQRVIDQNVEKYMKQFPTTPVPGGDK